MEPTLNPTIQPTTPVIPTPPLPEPPKQNGLKFVILAMALLIIILAGLVIYLFQMQTHSQPIISNSLPTAMPSPTSTPIDETANWKTYTDSNKKLTFKYPSNLSIAKNNEVGISSSTNGNPKEIDTFVDKSTIHQGTDGPFVGFAIATIDIPSSFDAFLTKEVNTEKSSPRGIYNEKINPLTLSTGYQAAYIDSEMNIRRYFIFNSKTNTAVVFSTASGSPVLLDIVNQILSTFKFTDQSQSQASNWKTYANTAYHYEIRYPSESQTVNIAAGGKGSAALPNAIEMYITAPNTREYDARLVNINYLGIIASPGSTWQKSTTEVNGTKTDKYTSSDSNFDIYEIAQTGQSGIEIYVQKNNSLASQIFSTFTFTQ